MKHFYKLKRLMRSEPQARSQGFDEREVITVDRSLKADRAGGNRGRAITVRRKTSVRNPVWTNSSGARVR
jgi:hypothetical protein